MKKGQIGVDGRFQFGEFGLEGRETAVGPGHARFLGVGDFEFGEVLQNDPNKSIRPPLGVLVEGLVGRVEILPEFGNINLTEGGTQVCLGVLCEGVGELGDLGTKLTDVGKGRLDFGGTQNGRIDVRGSGIEDGGSGTPKVSVFGSPSGLL